MSGFAVFDVETTGFAFQRSDRVCEVGLVLLDTSGCVEDEFSTLVNPKRDLGAQHIHGIDAADVRLAPTFEEIAGDLTQLLRGRVLVAHNASFDIAFLRSEYHRAGHPIDLTAGDALCTMRLASTIGAPAKLVECCAYFGIPLENSHSALDDARAASGVLQNVLKMTSPTQFTPWFDYAARIPWPDLSPRRVQPILRGAASTRQPATQRVSQGYEGLPEPEVANEYLDLLSRVLDDRKITASEGRALQELADDLGLSAQDVARINVYYVSSVARQALEDGVLSAQERADIIQFAHLLGLSERVTHELIRETEFLADRVESSLQLTPGDLIVLTGMSEARKRELAAAAQRAGLVVWPNIKKGVAAVVALDPNSDSTKARKAREYGIPVVGETTFEGWVASTLD